MTSQSKRSTQTPCAHTGLFSTIEGEHALFDACPFGVFRLDADNRLRYANQAFLDAYGIEHHEVEGKTASEFYDSEAGEVFHKSNRILRQNGRILAEVQRHTNPRDGESQYIELVRVPLFDEHDAFLGCRCLWWALTDFQDPELFESQPERKTGVNRHVIEHVMLIDRDATIRATSGLQGNLLSSICKPEQALLRHHIRRAFDDGIAGLLNVYSDGYGTLWSCRVVPLDDGTTPTVLVHLARVMLQHQDLIESAQRLDIVTRYCATLAHDLNNLFTVISCNASILQPQEEDAEIIEDITNAVTRAQLMVRRMRDFVVDDGLGLEWIDLTSFLSKRLDKFSKIAQDIHLSLTPSSVDGVIYVNPARFEEVILTLLLLIENQTPGAIDVILDVTVTLEQRLELNIHTPEVFCSRTLAQQSRRLRGPRGGRPLRARVRWLLHHQIISRAPYELQHQPASYGATSRGRLDRWCLTPTRHGA